MNSQKQKSVYFLLLHQSLLHEWLKQGSNSIEAGAIKSQIVVSSTVSSLVSLCMKIHSILQFVRKQSRNPINRAQASLTLPRTVHSSPSTSNGPTIPPTRTRHLTLFVNPTPTLDSPTRIRMFPHSSLGVLGFSLTIERSTYVTPRASAPLQRRRRLP